jgi:hypothetical protein
MNLEFSDKRRNQIALVFLGISWCALAVLSAQGIFGYPFRSVFTLDSENFVAAGGFAIQLHCRSCIRLTAPRVIRQESTKIAGQLPLTRIVQPRSAIVGEGCFLSRKREDCSFPPATIPIPEQAECIVRLAPAQRFDSGIGCRVYRKMACNDSLHSLHLPSDFLPTFVEGCRRDSSADAAGQCGEY